MLHKIIAVFDVVGNQTVNVSMASSDGLFVRQNANIIAQQFPLTDIRLYEIAQFDSNSLETIPTLPPRLISWDSYKYPENPLEPLNMSEKQKIQATMPKDNISNVQKTVDVVEKSE